MLCADGSDVWKGDTRMRSVKSESVGWGSILSSLTAMDVWMELRLQELNIVRCTGIKFMLLTNFLVKETSEQLLVLLKELKKRKKCDLQKVRRWFGVWWQDRPTKLRQRLSRKRSALCLWVEQTTPSSVFDCIGSLQKLWRKKKR